MSVCWGLFIEGGVLNDIDKNVLRKVGNRNLDLDLLRRVKYGNQEYIRRVRKSRIYLKKRLGIRR